MNKKYTIIVKVFNRKNMLERTMKSMLGQSIGIKDGMEVILYQTKDTKESQSKLCEQYQEKYPKNIRIYRDELSDTVEGEYLNYLQEGQFWHEDAFEVAFRLAHSYEQPLRVIQEQYKPTDEKIKGVVMETDCMVDVANHAEGTAEDPGKYLFHQCYYEKLRQIIQSEDKLDVIFYLMDILFDNDTMGLLFTRKRFGKPMEFAPKTVEWFTEQLPQAVDKLWRMAEESHNQYRRNIEFIIMYQIAEALKTDVHELLSEEYIQELTVWIKAQLDLLDDYVIIRGKMNGVTRRMALQLKYGDDYGNEMRYRQGKLMFHNLTIYNLAESKTLELQQSDEKQSGVIKGVSKHPLNPADFRFYLWDRKQGRYYFEATEEVGGERWCLNQKMLEERVFRCCLPKGVIASELVLMYEYKDVYHGVVYQG